MKSNRGVTLVGLVMYIIAFVIIVGIIGTITSFFYSNTQNMNDTATSLGEFNKFNLEFVREAKLEGNKVYGVSTYTVQGSNAQANRIAFTSGTSFTYVNGSLYKDRIKLCDNVLNCQFAVEKQEEKEIIVANIAFKDFSRTIRYVMLGSENQVDSNIEENYTTASEKQYIQDGLVLHYDGINNTGDGHSSTTDTWRDLSPNHNDAILTNVTWGDNYAIFNGTTSIANCGVQNSDYQTLIVTFSTTTASGSYYTLIGNYQNGGGGICMNSNKTISGEFYANGTLTTSSSDQSIDLGNIYQAVVTYDGSYIRLYIDGSLVKETEYANGIIATPTNNTVMALGVNPYSNSGASNWFNGKIYSAAVYNRALTTDEIINNYEVDRAKYGF